MFGTGVAMTRRPSTTAFSTCAGCVAIFVPSFLMLRISGSSDLSFSVWTTFWTRQAGVVPFSVLSGEAVKNHIVVSSTMNPASAVNAMRNPRRAPRFVPSSR